MNVNIQVFGNGWHANLVEERHYILYKVVRILSKSYYDQKEKAFCKKHGPRLAISSGGANKLKLPPKMPTMIGRRRKFWILGAL